MRGGTSSTDRLPVPHATTVGPSPGIGDFKFSITVDVQFDLHVSSCINLCNRPAQGSAAQMYKFVADPPTTTMQRLRGILTVR